MSLLHWVWLGIALQPGSPLIDVILERYPDPEEFFLSGNSGIDEVGCISDYEALRIRASSLDLAKSAMERAQNYGAEILCRTDPDFPQQLLNINSCPAALYVLGDKKVLNRMPAVAVVGTRSMTDYGRRACETIAGGLGKAGATVVSGMAKGVDSEAHKACIENSGKTVAVQGCGICNTYPAENCELKEIIAANGAVISEFTPDTEPQSSFFPIRNRIVSGMSLGVCVIEAAARSGTSITANFAIEQGRQVFAVPSDVFRSTSQGTFRLLRQGAIPVASAADILSEYRGDYGEKINFSVIEKSQPEAGPSSVLLEKSDPTPSQKVVVPDNMSGDAAAIYKTVGRTPRYADELSMDSGLSAAATAAALTELEIYGLVRSVSGRRFVKVQ